MYIKIRNWERFQGKKQPGKRYFWRKLYVPGACSESFNSLPLRTRGLALLLIQACDDDGSIYCGRRSPAQAVAGTLRVTCDRWIAAGISELIVDGFLAIDTRDHSVITPASLGDHSGITPASLGDHSGITPASLRHQQGTDDANSVDQSVITHHVRVLKKQEFPEELPQLSFNRASSVLYSGRERSEEKRKEREERNARKRARAIARHTSIAKQIDPIYREAAEQLWADQEKMREEAIPGAIVRSPSDDRLSRIAERLANGATREQCEHVLRVYAAEARADPERCARWFDGVSNWRKENFERALGRIVARPSASKPPASTPACFFPVKLD